MCPVEPVENRLPCCEQIGRLFAFLLHLCNGATAPLGQQRSDFLSGSRLALGAAFASQLAQQRRPVAWPVARRELFQRSQRLVRDVVVA